MPECFPKNFAPRGVFQRGAGRSVVAFRQQAAALGFRQPGIGRNDPGEWVFFFGEPRCEGGGDGLVRCDGSELRVLVRTIKKLLDSLE